MNRYCRAAAAIPPLLAVLALMCACASVETRSTKAMGSDVSAIGADLRRVEPCDLLTADELVRFSLGAGRPENPEPAFVENCLLDVSSGAGGRASINFYFEDAADKLTEGINRAQVQLSMVQIRSTRARQGYEAVSSNNSSACILLVDFGARQWAIFTLHLDHGPVPEGAICGFLNEIASAALPKIVDGAS
jgi:Protein of unknown function (DUF3558)